MALLSESIRHQDFPVDGRIWWIRWVDRIDPSDKTGTPTIQVMLSPLLGSPVDGPDGFPEITHELAQATLRAPKPEIFLVRVHVSSIPFFPLGALFRDGFRCGRLPLERRQYVLGKDWKRAFLSGNQQSPARKPRWWKTTWNVLPVSRYSRGGNAASFIVVLHHTSGCSRFRQIVIPSYEVFRTFYAPGTKLAGDLLSNPWGLSEVRDKIVNAAHTGMLPDGTWQIGLRNGLGADAAWLVGNLVMTDFGADCATRLTEEFPRDRRLWKQAARLKADIPLQWTKLCLKVEGFALYDPGADSVGVMDKFVVLRIEEVSFPSLPEKFPMKVIARLDNNNVERTADGSKEKEPSAVLHVLVVPNEDVVLLTADESPLHSALPIEMATDVSVWSGLALPEIARSAAEDGRVAGARPFLRATDMGSTAGRPGSSARDVGRVTGRPDESASGEHVFERLALTLDDLKKAGKIDGWKSVTDVGCSALPLYRPGYVALRIPLDFASKADGKQDKKLKQWIIPTRGKFCGRHRKIMIAEVVESGRTTYCLEIEPFSDTGNYCLGVARFDGTDRDFVIRGLADLVRVATQVRGVWPRDRGGMANVAGLEDWMSAKHRYLGDKMMALDLSAMIF